jgi:hypothetical protein
VWVAGIIVFTPTVGEGEADGLIVREGSSDGCFVSVRTNVCVAAAREMVGVLEGAVAGSLSFELLGWGLHPLNPRPSRNTGIKIFIN